MLGLNGYFHPSLLHVIVASLGALGLEVVPADTGVLLLVNVDFKLRTFAEVEKLVLRYAVKRSNLSNAADLKQTRIGNPFLARNFFRTFSERGDEQSSQSLL